jgi:hypothetical protein
MSFVQTFLEVKLAHLKQEQITNNEKIIDKTLIFF